MTTIGGHSGGGGRAGRSGGGGPSDELSVLQARLQSGDFEPSELPGIVDRMAELERQARIQKPAEAPISKIEQILNSARDKDLQKVSEEHRYSYQSYSGDNFRHVNDFILGKNVGSEHIEEAVQTKIGLDAIMEKARVPTNLTVYRGVQSSFADKVNLSPGSIIHNPTFTSTSLSKSIVNGFADKGSNGTRTVLRINVPKGTRGLYIGRKSHVSNEKELLLDRGSVLRVARSTIVKDTKYVDCDII